MSVPEPAISGGTALDSGHSSEVVVETRGTQPIELRLEPWGETYTLPIGARLRALFDAPAMGSIEIIHSATGIELWGWSRSSVRIWLDDEELGMEHRRGVPRTRFP
jgi:hypothetical protein